ncbi:MAG: N-6 DNA methylase, partial [Bacteroidia bacterium]|nr:N-6 DNA methylase [Bacteroidia bacterium]
MSYTTVIPNNYFFSQEILQLIQQAQIDGQTPKDFGYPSLAELENHIQSAFQQTLLAYSQFKIYLEEEDTNKTAQPTQDFAIVFLKSLGYTPQRYLAPIVGTNQKQYSITYGDPIRAKFPIHIVPHLGKKNSLDSRLHDRYTPHNLLQEYLNTSEQLFGLLTNGTTLRLLRQSNRLVNPPFLTINLQQMLEEEKLEEFALVYRLLHVSRAPQSIGNITECLLEKYYQKTVESGSRIREKLGEAVKQAIIHLANSFLKHPANKILRQQLAQRTLSTKELYAQLRRIIYRMLFLLVLEERRNIFPSTSYEEELPSYLQEIYYQYYSISRLRILAEKELSASALRQSDFWQRVLQTFKFFEPQNDFSPLGIEPLNGDLFSTTAISNLQNCQLTNKDFIQVLRYLHFFEDEKGYRLQINYRALDVEELGSVYERLLALHPIINDKLEFSFDEGMERKSTGSYYTPHDLVKELIQSALIPVIEERLKAHEGDKKKQIQALREISICDPACGSGHMLLEAARTLAMEIAKIESGEEEPSPELYRRVLRQVVQENIYGVDLNPDAVELCKVALWLEGHNSGKPLSFLDHKIRCGNSLVGVVKPEVLRKGIPSAAYEAKEGDDKKICQSLKKDNQNYLKTRQGTLDFDYKIIEGEITEASQAYERIIHLPQEKLVQVEQVAREYRAFLKSEIWYKEWQACNLWVAPFFLRYTSELKSEEIPTSERLEKFLNASAVSYNFMLQKANSLSVEYRFFHWYLEFPNVFTKGGFDVMLGNPPWEVPEVKDKEFFKAIPSIAQVSQANIRKKLIQGLKNSPKEDERELYQEYLKSITYHEAFRLFLRESSRFDLTSTGRMNLYSIFAELFSKLIAPQGRAGFIVPTGIATDD